VELICRCQDESRIRSLLLQTVGRLPCGLYALRSESQPSGVLVDADLRLADRNDELMEQIVTRLSQEDCVSAISWKLLPASGEHPSRPTVALQEEET
jgi:putative Mg2+ transporter-C (MgtC) family protein